MPPVVPPAAVAAANGRCGSCRWPWTLLPCKPAPARATMGSTYGLSAACARAMAAKTHPYVYSNAAVASTGVAGARAISAGANKFGLCEGHMMSFCLWE